MSLDWQIQHRWGSHNHKLTPFLAISLLLHGVVFLGLAIYWHGKSVNHLLQPKPNAPVPIKFIDLPPDKAAVKPSPSAKYSASRNSRAGGPFRRDLPAMIGRLGTSRSIPNSSSLPSRAQAKSSIPHPTQPEKLPSQVLAEKVSPPQAANSVASFKPRRQTSKQASPPTSPVVRSTEKPLPPTSPIARSIEKPPTSEPVTRHPDANLLPSPKPKQSRERLLPHPQTNPVVKHTQYLPNTSRLAFNHRPDSSSHTFVPPTEHVQNHDHSSLSQQSRSVTEGEQHPPTSNRLAFNRPSSSGVPTTTSQLPQKSHNQLPSWQQASNLGGTVSLPSHNLRDGGDNLSNSNRLAYNSAAGVDTRQDEIGPYLAALKQRVAQQWRHENPGSSKHTVIFFAVNRNGQITPPRLVQTSGSDKIDQAALAAVEHAAPFAPLPESFREAQLSIEFTFNIFDIDLSQP